MKLSERVYEDHELLVENLLLWTRDSKNKLLFVERPDKTQLFLTPERFLLGPTDRGGGEYDDHSRNILLEEFFSSSNVGVPEVSETCLRSHCVLAIEPNDGSEFVDIYSISSLHRLPFASRSRVRCTWNRTARRVGRGITLFYEPPVFITGRRKRRAPLEISSVWQPSMLIRFIFLYTLSYQRYII